MHAPTQLKTVVLQCVLQLCCSVYVRCSCVVVGVLAGRARDVLEDGNGSLLTPLAQDDVKICIYMYVYTYI